MISPYLFGLLFYFFLAYFLVASAYYALMATIGVFQSRKRIFESREEDYASFVKSGFTMPVSIIIPAHNEEDWIEDCIKSLLNLDYPKFEIIIVNDASTDNTMKIVNKLLKLKKIDRADAEKIVVTDIVGVYKSEAHPNVLVIDKYPGTQKAGAVNAGLDLAHNEYVCLMDADTVVEPDALLKIMPHIESGAENIIGAGSYFGLVNGFKVKDGKILDHSFSYNPIVAFQNIEYIRNFIGNRLSWSAFNALPIVSGGFSIWKKSIIQKVGGYDPTFTCEDIELTFRVQDYIVKNNKNYRVLSFPYYVAWTEGPAGIRSLIIQRERWQRVTNETIWRYRHMMFNPKYGWFGFMIFPYFVIYEVLGVFFEAASIGVVVWAFLAGLLNMKVFILSILLMSLSMTFISLFVLLALLRDQRIFKLRYTLYLIFLSWCELLLYRWINVIARMVGTVRFFMGVKTFDQYKRGT